MERHIRFFNSNACSVVNTERIQEIAKTLKPDIAVLTGTRIRLPAGSSYTVQRLAGYTAVHFGWGRGCYTNRSTVVCILLGKRFLPRMTKEVSFPPTSLAGRGGAMRLERGTMDLGIQEYYCLTEGSTDGFSTIDGLDENSSFELAEQSFHDCSW